MRTRLSAKYSMWVKLPITLIVFVIAFIIAAKLNIIAFLDAPRSYIFEIILLFACCRLVFFVLKDRKVIEFDESFLYIVDNKQGIETRIPLKNITWLNRRLRDFKVGALWFCWYSLHYLDEFNQQQRIRFFIKVPSEPCSRFAGLVKGKNPDFRFKNWSWNFDNDK